MWNKRKHIRKKENTKLKKQTNIILKGSCIYFTLTGSFGVVFVVGGGGHENLKYPRKLLRTNKYFEKNIWL